MPTRPPFTVLDLFSGAGGMSFGFHADPSFRVIGAVDAQNAKPSMGSGTLECNKTYAANINVKPLQADLATVEPETVDRYVKDESGTTDVDVLISCAPCTGFSRTIRTNLVSDNVRNSLVARSARFVEHYRPSLFVMENVGELLEGRFTHHFQSLREDLERLGYNWTAAVHSLDNFGLPQRRRRALVVAAQSHLALRTIEDLWSGYGITPEAVTVRRAIAHLPPVAAGETHPDDPMHVSPAFSTRGLERLKRIPPDGGSWPDLLAIPDGANYLIPSMERQLAKGRVGPYRDVYGRLAWDRPAVTLKRECGHTGNGRYAHPEQHRHCTVRELATLQGFPQTYTFLADSTGNMYRHIGDAVPPLISYQIAALCNWILTDKRPDIHDLILPNTHLTKNDIVPAASPIERPSLACAN